MRYLDPRPRQVGVQVIFLFMYFKALAYVGLGLVVVAALLIALCSVLLVVC